MVITIDRKEVQGCVTFHYRDFIISLSTTANPNELQILDSDKEFVTDRLFQRNRGDTFPETPGCSAEDLRAAMAVIDREHKRLNEEF